MRRSIGPVAIGLVCSFAGAHGAPAGEGFAPRWVAGDLHVHTTYSHDSWSGPSDDNTEIDEAYTFGWSPAEQILIAESRGLDFLAITDHNDTRSTVDPGWRSDRLVLIPAYENSLAGHAQMIGASSCYAPSGATGILEGCNAGVDTHDRDQVQQMAERLRADGGVFQINHPYDGDWLLTFGDGSADLPIVPDSVEVWNIGPWHYQPPFPAASDNETSLGFWQTFLDARLHVAATGGSDNHWRTTTAVQGVGQPTTWVYVTEPGIAGIIAGIRAGRTDVSAEPPALFGPRLFLEADGDGDGDYDSKVGDTIPQAATIAVHLRAENLLPGAVYRIVSDLEAKEELAITADLTTTIAAAKWVRAELRRPDLREERRELCDPLIGSPEMTYCRNGLFVEALTSAIYVAAQP